MRRFCVFMALMTFGFPQLLPGTEPLDTSRFSQEGEDAPEILKTTPTRSEVEQDHLTAASMFAHGRLLYQREKFAEALRRYERAYRYDPDAVVILGEIVSLAFEVGHNEEAARYAVLAAEKDPRDALLLRRLAMHLTEQEDYARALKLYQKSFELQKDADDVTSLLLYMEMGRLHFLLEEFQPAAKAFERVRDAILDPKKYGLSDELYKIVLGNAPGTYALLGECFLQAGKYDDAEVMFRKSNEAKADEASLHYHLARIRAKQEKIDAALEELEAYFKTKSDAAGVEPYELLNELYVKKHADDAPAKVLARLQELHAAAKDNAALDYVLANKLHAVKQDDKAIEVLTKSLDKEATAEVSSLLVELLHQQQKMPALLTALGNSVGKSGALSALGDAGVALIKDEAAFAKLVAEAKERKAADKLTAGEALAVALLSLKAKKYDATDEFFPIAIEKPPVAKTALPKAEAVLTWGLELFQADEFDRAAKVFQNAIDKKQAPQREDLLYYFLSSALEMQGKTDEALAAIEKTLKGDKPAARMLGRKAWILYHAKRYEESEKLYRELLAKWDSDHKTSGNRETMREARMVLSNIGVQTNRRAEGTEWLEQVLDEYPEDIGAMNDLGYLWAEEGIHLHRAQAMLEKAVAAEPENHAYRDSLGWVYYQAGMYPQAIAELEKAADVSDPDGVILDHLADAYHKAGQTDKALATWQRAADAFGAEKEETKQQTTLEKIKQLQK